MEIQQIDHELKSHFLNLYSIALSDTQVDTTELEFLFRFGQERGVSKEEIESLILHPDRIKFHIPTDILKKIDYLYDFALMIWADGKVDIYEEAALKKFCLKFGFKNNNIDALANFLIEEAEKGTSKSEVFKIVQQNI